MITYDYLIERDEVDKVVQYKPGVIPTSLPNLVYIEGPNSSGKSTLLHFIALACHGTENETIKAVLKNKMRSLIDSAHQKVTFTLRITDGHNKTVLFSEKKDAGKKNIVLRDGAKNIITAEKFNREYVLIYDIPENPTTRLKELILEIKNMQSQLETRVALFRGVLTAVIGDIQQARDPNRIQGIKTEIKKFISDQEKKEIDIATLDERYKAVRLYSAVKFATQFKEILSRYENDKKKLSKEDNQLKKENKKLNEARRSLLKEKRNLIIQLRSLFSQITLTIQDFYGKGKDAHRYELWKTAEIEKEVDSPKIYTVLQEEGTYFYHLLCDEIKQHEKAASYQEATILRKMINLLEGYQGVEITIPAADLPLSKFIVVLRSALSKHEDILAKCEKASSCIKNLDSMFETRNRIINEINPQLDEIDEQYEDVKEKESEKDDSKIDRLDELITEVKKKLEYYRSECSKMDIREEDIEQLYASLVLGKAMKELDNYEEPALRSKLMTLNEDLATRKREKEKIESNLAYLQRDLNQLENKKPHQYHNNLRYLKDSLLPQIQQIERTLGNYNRYLDYLVKDKKFDDKDDKKERSFYFDCVFAYLAKRIGIIRHVDTEYELKQIDLVNQQITTTNGKTIKISDLGTGQSQSAYLMGLLNRKDNKKIIALFDEVAMMDEKSLQPVKKKLIELHKTGKLIAGVIVQKADQIQVQPLVKG